MAGIFGQQLGTLQKALDYHAKRHNVLASNVANANTPRFVPSELLRTSDVRGPRPLPMRVTAEGHMDSAGALNRPDFEVLRAPDHVGGLDGNRVSLERQMSKLAANDIRYQGASRLVSAALARLSYAANDGGAG